MSFFFLAKIWINFDEISHLVMSLTLPQEALGGSHSEAVSPEIVKDGTVSSLYV